MQAFPPRGGIGAMAAAGSRAFGPFGGDGAISFETVATLAFDHLPPGASRAELVAGIGRGLGRVAAHELAHQILPLGDLHASRDPASYDFGSINRASQFYGPMHWDLAGPRLRAALGTHRTAASPR